MEIMIIGATKIVIQSSPDWKEWEKQLTNSFSVFLHSANYKFSLGSGSSFMVKQIIDAERAGTGKSRLEKEIQRIKKTPICGVKLTNGGILPELFTGKSLT